MSSLAPSSVSAQASVSAALLSLTAAQLDDLNHPSLARAVRDAGNRVERRLREDEMKMEDKLEKVKKQVRQRFRQKMGINNETDYDGDTVDRERGIGIETKAKGHCNGEEFVIAWDYILDLAR